MLNTQLVHNDTKGFTDIPRVGSLTCVLINRLCLNVSKYMDRIYIVSVYFRVADLLEYRGLLELARYPQVQIARSCSKGHMISPVDRWCSRAPIPGTTFPATTAAQPSCACTCSDS